MTSEQEEAIIKNYFNFLTETENVKIPDIFFKKIKDFFHKDTVITTVKIDEGDNYFFFYDSKYKNTEKYIVI